MGLMSWVGKPFGLLSGPWRAFFGMSTTSGETVTYDHAMQLDAVWACVNLISNAVKTLPCNVYKGDGVEIDRENQLYELLHDMPNLDDSASDFWGMAALCLCLDGNFFAEKKQPAGRLIALYPLDPTCVEIKRDDKNNRYYEVNEKGQGGKARKVLGKDMLHVRGLVMPGCDRGLSPIGAQRNVIGNALAGEKTSGRMFKNGMLPSVLLSSDQVLKAEQRKQIAESLQAFAGADKAGGVAVLEAGLTPTQITINPKDAQMLEARQYSVEQIARVFGIPPVMIGHAANGTTTWGSGIEQLILQFVKTCLMPMLRSIESAIYRDILDVDTRKTTVVKFNMEGLLRGDSAARAEFLSKMVNAGIYEPDEARAYENKAPRAGGNRLIVQGAMTPLATLGETPQQPSAE